MEVENIKNKLKMGKCLLVTQEGKGKSDLWKTFDFVVETSGDQENGGCRIKCCVNIMCAKQLLLRLQYYYYYFLTIWNRVNNTQ
jgi:hypothetical protein